MHATRRDRQFLRFNRPNNNRRSMQIVSKVLRTYECKCFNSPVTSRLSSDGLTSLIQEKFTLPQPARGVLEHKLTTAKWRLTCSLELSHHRTL